MDLFDVRVTFEGIKLKDFSSKVPHLLQNTLKYL